MTDMETNDPTIHIQMNHFDSGDEIIDALVLNAFLNGRLPWYRTTHLDQVRGEATLLPDGAVASRVSVSSNRRAYLAEGDGWMVHVTRWGDASAGLDVLARDEAMGTRILEEITTDAIEDANDDDDNVVTVG